MTLAKIDNDKKLQNQQVGQTRLQYILIKNLWLGFLALSWFSTIPVLSNVEE